MIKVGDRIPEATLKLKTDDAVEDVSTGQYFAGKKVVLFAVPGAFTPTCHQNHLPGYLMNVDDIKAKGVEKVAVVAVNDHHVMKAWADATGGYGKIDYLADGSAKFVSDMGLSLDLTGGGLGIRSTRFSMIVEDGVVKALNVEDGGPGKVTNSGADHILTQL